MSVTAFVKEKLLIAGYETEQVFFAVNFVKEFYGLLEKEKTAEKIYWMANISDGGFLILDAWFEKRWISVWLYQTDESVFDLGIGARGCSGIWQEWGKYKWTHGNKPLIDWLMGRRDNKKT